MTEEETPYDLRDILDNLVADLGQSRLHVATLKAELKAAKEQVMEERRKAVQLMERIADLSTPRTVIEHSDSDLGVVVDGEATVTDGDSAT